MAVFPTSLIAIGILFLALLLADLYLGFEAYTLYGGDIGKFILVTLSGYLIVAVFAASFALELTGLTVYSASFKYAYDTFNQVTYTLGFGLAFYGLFGIRHFVEKKEGGDSE
ncbi:MAG: hypothetical protein SVV03_06610 [Candidatus Nanohaloarchaea archaeon]|nr:hypothetical protein [Candidatus Nanohaloarchaea archaeon]